jgi:membrane associated rhomboid family serine protease
VDRILARLERTFLGKLAIERLTIFIVGGMGIAFLLAQTRPDIIQLMTLEPSLVSKQPWRLVTYLFLPSSLSIVWTLVALYFTWLVGSNLEHEWGPFKFNAYYLLGALGTTAAAFITGEAQGNFYLNMSLYFAFATLFPDFQILLFFILPIRIKWLAILAALGVVLEVVIGDNATRAAIGVAFGNYLLFFGAHILAFARGQRVMMKQAARRSVQRGAAYAAQAKSDGRVCAICGARQEDGADIRVCSCEKCGGPRDLCLEHARNH